MEEYNDMQLLKRRMFAMRNGIIADTLRKAGSPFSIIFGVNLPQLTEIARDFDKSKDFANRVWANSSTRESMLIAPMLMPADEFTIEDARAWIAQIPTAEVADVLCLKLLRNEPYALDLARELIGSDLPMGHYTGLRLMCNLAPQHPAEAVKIGREELQKEKPQQQLAAILISYEEFL